MPANDSIQELVQALEFPISTTPIKIPWDLAKMKRHFGPEEDLAFFVVESSDPLELLQNPSDAFGLPSPVITGDTAFLLAKARFGDGTRLPQWIRSKSGTPTIKLLIARIV